MAKDIEGTQMQEGIIKTLLKWYPTGIGGGITAHFLINHEWTQALVSTFVTACIALWTQFSQGFMREMEKILKNAGEMFAKWLAKWLPETIKKPLQTFRFQSQYCQNLVDNYRAFRTEGLITRNPFTPDLEKVFVPLQVAPKDAGTASQTLIPLSVSDKKRLPKTVIPGQESKKEELDIWNFLARIIDQPAYKHMVIIGGPGSGKTTLLEHLTLTYAQNKQYKYARKSPKLIPILLFLRKICDSITSKKEPDLSQLITEQLKNAESGLEINLPPKWFEEKLSQGKCLVMLDGMDEVADEKKRQLVSEWIDEQIRQYRKTTFILTSRPLGYRNSQLKEVTTSLEVKPFNFKQISKFVHSWYLENQILSEVRKVDTGVRIRAEQKANDLITRLQEHPPTLDMAQNPLLLTMIATLHNSGQVLPKSRGVLYEEMCYVLLERRRESKSLPDSLNLTREQKQSILQVLAFELKCQKIREFDLTKGTAIIKDELTNVAGNKIIPETFIKYIESDSGLIVEIEEGVYGFAHLSFQDYLTAVQVKEVNQEQLLIDNINHDWWAEVIRLYAPKNDTSKLIEAALDNPTELSLILAFDCLDEGKKVQQEVRERLEKKLEEDLNSPDQHISDRAGRVKLSRLTKITSN
ncbi:MAG: NACHT domain-containing protein [Microcystis aeruginosa Ma_MB_F_20061100_S19]|nr:NACHT domain-containing protein [Microcystis aeruginosa]NCR96861.1 NACHT domain-containing protein [Microcystis aeruginosa L311-01]TRU14380.1 MAG: NACHT domain-containing protein [Microcystis aeruginosa Ma_MB_F_20061100_S19D]TRU18150.1 MAG: NACHT domain-containing protein [Microcystis aeruginosa Ma_MB_F_20061100_S19]